MRHSLRGTTPFANLGTSNREVTYTANFNSIGSRTDLSTLHGPASLRRRYQAQVLNSRAHLSAMY